MKRGVIIYSVSAIKVWVYAVLVSQSVRIFVDLFFFLVICMSGTSDPPLRGNLVPMDIIDRGRSFMLSIKYKDMDNGYNSYEEQLYSLS